ncbi:MAG: hypothetical protein DRQ88_08945 [Epsilonproteobacteria bacterium]|nr:MAG: hypothetical protein DRQ89_06530 [Campylobacterota bacterium]RLA65659.1 MAG: hypothetical protein DRQ88_08945 [Campylobacterota bacterium]
MKISDKNTSNPGEIKRPAKKDLSKQEIRDMVESNKKKRAKGIVKGDKMLGDSRAPHNIERLKQALSDGTINFSPQDRAILEKLINP